MWGEELSCEEDVWRVFYNYVSAQQNNNGKIVSKMPWNDDPMSGETLLIKEELTQFNNSGILTINSQPHVNGVPSSDPVLGWGAPGGFVYQKAYLEFFTCPKKTEALKKILPKYPQINYHIINKSGEKDYTNCHKYRPLAVTWGVFPNSEIIQPTVVDPVTFKKVWKNEAFTLWTEEWGKLYPEASRSRQIIQDISDTYYLINLIDNNYPDKTTCIWDLIRKAIQLADEMEDVVESVSNGSASNGHSCEAR